MHMSRFMSNVALATALVAGAAVPLGGARAVTVINGSFEVTTHFVPNVDDTMRLSVGSLAMTGWTVVNSGLAWIGPTNTFGLTASNGSYFLDLTDYTDVSPYGGVSQIITTVAGQHYLLSFDLGSSTPYGTPDAITATASAGPTSGTFTSTLSGTNNWQLETLAFIAASTSTTITLIGYSANRSYIGLDNVSVTATPLPAALPLFATGLGALGLLGWRRKRKNSAALAAA